MRPSRTQFEATLFVWRSSSPCVAGFAISNNQVTNTLYFAAWCAALLLLFSLGLRLPLSLRSRYALLATAASLSPPPVSDCLPMSRCIGTTRFSTLLKRQLHPAAGDAGGRDVSIATSP